MAKVIAVKSGTKLAALLEQKGYVTVPLYEVDRRRQPVDAVLYTGYHPDINSRFHSVAETADITLGSGMSLPTYDQPTAIMLNVTGMHPEQALNTLELHLRHHQ